MEAKVIQVVYVKSEGEQSFYTLDGQLICTVRPEAKAEKPEAAK